MLFAVNKIDFELLLLHPARRRCVLVGNFMHEWWWSLLLIVSRGLEVSVELLSLWAQSQETTAVDSDQYLDFDESQELVISEIWLHTKNSMMTIQGTVNKHKGFLWVQVLSWRLIFQRMKRSFPSMSIKLKRLRSTGMHMPLLWLLGLKLGAAKHSITRNKDTEADPWNSN